MINVDSVTIGSYNTYTTWGLIPASPLTIAPFPVKTSYVEIPGFSKRYDFTEALQGSVPYSAAEGSWSFYAIGAGESLHQTITDAIHGKRFSVTYAGKTYTGRVTVDSWTNHKYPDSVYAEAVIGYSLDP